VNKGKILFNNDEEYKVLKNNDSIMDKQLPLEVNIEKQKRLTNQEQQHVKLRDLSWNAQLKKHSLVDGPEIQSELLQKHCKYNNIRQSTIANAEQTTIATAE
jgi:hypothetical protein